MFAACDTGIAYVDGDVRTVFYGGNDDDDDADDDFIVLSYSIDFSNGTLSLLLPVLLLLTLSSCFKEGLLFSVLASTSVI